MIKTVHVIFKTHLDIGFTDTAAAVIDSYFKNFIPSALELARKTRERGGNRFIWTTGSWLIDEFLEKGDRAMRKRMESAIEMGDIDWHALPFTVHTELMDSSLFRAGLDISARLDKRFGKKTIAAKMTDVPGHCRAIIPILADAGVEFLHIGVNPASKTVDLPPLFNWESPCGSRIIVNYVSGYGQPLNIEGLDHSLYFAHSGDNCGPPTEDHLTAEFNRLREIYSDSRISGSTLDNFAESLRPISQKLPVVKGEMGDTWIHGVGSDPLKIARFRQLCRLRKEWKDSGRSAQEPGFDKFSRTLLMIPEHTWGMDEKTHLKDYKHYSREDFFRARAADLVAPEVIKEGEERFCAFKLDETDLSSERESDVIPSFSKFESSWDEQRRYIGKSLDCLKEPAFIEEAEKALEEVEPKLMAEKSLAQEGYTPLELKPEYAMGDFSFSLSEQTGALTYLARKRKDEIWCRKGQSLGLFQYEIFSSRSYDHFYETYNINRDWTGGWSVPDFTKPGLEKLGSLKHRFYLPKKARFYQKDTEILCCMNMPEESVDLYGAPEKLQISYNFGPGDEIAIDFRWSSKKACRIPEAFWLSFIPQTDERPEWTIDKMGESVSPFEIIDGGNRALHCTQNGISCSDGKGYLRIEPLDTPLVSPGRPRILEFDQSRPDLKEGVHFNLLNNLWGTNFPMWYEDDGLSRFRLHFGKAGS